MRSMKGKYAPLKEATKAMRKQKWRHGSGEGRAMRKSGWQGREIATSRKQSPPLASLPTT